LDPDAIGRALEEQKEKSLRQLWKRLRKSIDVLFSEPGSLKLAQRLLLVAGILLLSAPTLWFLQHFNFLPNSGGSIKVSAIGGTGIEINYPTGEGKSESVAVISVPAYRMATPSGIIIKPGDSVEIGASGTIATDSAFNDWLPPP